MLEVAEKASPLLSDDDLTEPDFHNRIAKT